MPTTPDAAALSAILAPLQTTLASAQTTLAGITTPGSAANDATFQQCNAIATALAAAANQVQALSEMVLERMRAEYRGAGSLYYGPNWTAKVGVLESDISQLMQLRTANLLSH